MFIGTSNMHETSINLSTPQILSHNLPFISQDNPTCHIYKTSSNFCRFFPYPHLHHQISCFQRLQICWKVYASIFLQSKFPIILPSASMAEHHSQIEFQRSQRCTANPNGQSWSLGTSGGLHQEVIRKNNQIIRNFLSKLNEVFIRQEQYEAGIKAIHEKLTTITQKSQSLQHDIRSTYLETSRQQSQLANDIAVIKNTLKIPSHTLPHEAYLASDFFRQRVNGISSRMRDHCGRTEKGKRTMPGQYIGGEVGVPTSGSRVSVQQQPIFSKDSNSPTAAKHKKNWSELPHKQPHQQHTTDGYQRHSEDSIHHMPIQSDITFIFEELKEKLQGCATKNGLEKSLSLIKEDLQNKLEKMLVESKHQCDWNHINFEEITNYIDAKVEEALADKVGKKYFEVSMANLKEAWQLEEKAIYEAIDLKAEGQQLGVLREKLAELSLKLQHPLRPFLKPTTTLLNSTLGPFLGKNTHHRVSVRDMHHPDSPDTTIISKIGEDRRKSRVNYQYINSLSLCRSIDKKQSKATAISNTFFDDTMVSQGLLKEKAWRDKANEALGEQKIKKKTKIIN